MAINPSLGNGCWVGANKTGIAVGQIQREEVRLLLNATNHHHGLAKISLGVTGGMSQRHKHLAAAPTVFTNVILDRRIAACRVALKSETRRVRLHFLPLIVRFDCHRAYASCTPLRDVINRSEQTLLLLEGAQ